MVEPIIILDAVDKPVYGFASIRRHCIECAYYIFDLDYIWYDKETGEKCQCELGCDIMNPDLCGMFKDIINDYKERGKA